MSIKPLLLAICLGCSSITMAAPANNDLSAIRQAISAAQADLQQKQAARQRAQKTLAQSQTAIEKAQHELGNLNRQQAVAWSKLQQLQNELERTRSEVANAKAQVSRLLSGYYKNRQPNAVVLFLKDAEPGQKNRYLQYTKYINQANEKAIADLAVQQSQLNQREKAVNNELARLKILRNQKQTAINQLGKAQNAARQQSKQLNAQIDNQSKRISRLRADEARLNNILAGIAKRNADNRKAQAGNRKKQAEQRLAETNRARKPSGNKNSPQSNRSGLTAEDRALTGLDQTSYNGLSQLQGRLRRPVGGNLTGRFGQPREGGGTWRGVFYATAPSGVHSIAAGRIAYAGNVSGYGNTVVVDHGNSYVSVYSGLNSLAVRGGSEVGSGSPLGTSGQLPDGPQGLYFEIRYNNLPMNPLSWVR